MLKKMKFLRSSKCSKTTVESTLTTEKRTLVVLGLTVLFLTGNTFLGKFGSKTQNYPFEWKFDT